MNRRRIRRYRNQRRNSGMKFLGIIGIMIIAVICGYLTARFVIAPLLGYDTEVLKLDLPSKLTAVLDRSGDSMKIQRIRTSLRKRLRRSRTKKRTMLKIMKTMTATVLIVKTRVMPFSLVYSAQKQRQKSWCLS